MAMPMSRWPLTTSTVRSSPARASTRTRLGSPPCPTRAIASYSASRMSSRTWRTRSSRRTANLAGPCWSGSYPSFWRSRSQRGAIRPAGRPSITRSRPSIMRPSSRPGVRWVIASARRLPRAESILMAFALRGAPCGDWAHRTVPEDARHPKDSAATRQAEHVETILVEGVTQVGRRHAPIVVLHRHGLFEADAVLAQVLPRLPRVPGFVHPGDRRTERSPGTHRQHIGELTANLSRGGRRVGTGSGTACYAMKERVR
jgi:hypothetical protein